MTYVSRSGLVTTLATTGLSCRRGELVSRDVGALQRQYWHFFLLKDTLVHS